METAEVEDIKPPLYVVLITGKAPNGAPVHGTGFIVNAQGHVVTCKHVVYPSGDGRPVTALHVHLPYPARKPQAYEVLGTSADDLAVLKSTTPLSLSVQEPMLHDNWERDTKVGDPVYVWGYSAAEHYTEAQRFDFKVSGFSGAHGRIGISGDVNFGDSGAPVLDGKRRVIGIAQAKDKTRAGQAMAIPVSLLRMLLREVGVADTGTDVVFQAPAPPDHALVGRDKLLQDLKDQLTGKRDVALCFKPGVGKSALAAALANDQDVRSHFGGGVLWASLNLTPNPLSELRKWGVALGLPPEKMEELDKLASALKADPALGQEQADEQAARQWAQALSRQIGQRRMLLVIDDAWELADVKALLLDAPNCGHLVTTSEQAKVARRLGASYDVTVVDELTEDDGLEFLRQLAPDAVDMFPDEARKVVIAVGGLPLGLLLLGTHLHQESLDAQRLQISDAYRDIQDTLDKYLKPLHGAIKILYDKLPDDETRAALHALSIFPPKPGKFSRDAALAVLQPAPSSVIYKLKAAGLIETMDNGGDPHDLPYTMHRTIAEFANELLPGEQVQQLHHRAADYFSKWLKEYEEVEHDSAKYGYQYRYENAHWQDAMDDFLYHLARSGDPASAILEFASIYFNAFWWWGCFADFPFCTRLLQQAATKRLSEEARRALDLLADFDVAYSKETQRQNGGDWPGVEQALTRLRELGGLDREVDELTASARHTRALTDIFLAEALRFGRKDYQQAQRLYQDALSLLPDTDWSRPWVLYHLGDMQLEIGRHDVAEIQCDDCLALAEDPLLPLKDRDNEVLANAYRLRAAVAGHLGRGDQVLEGYQRTVLHAYAFQAIPEPPDAYTVAFYRQITAHTARQLQSLHRAEPARALGYCRDLRDYWSSYRELARVADASASEADVENMLRADAADALCAYLFPAAPTPDVMHVRGSRYFNEAITIHNEKMGQS